MPRHTQDRRLSGRRSNGSPRSRNRRPSGRLAGFERLEARWLLAVDALSLWNAEAAAGASDVEADPPPPIAGPGRYVDASGAVLFADPPLAADQLPDVSESEAVGVPPFPLGDTFTLHSRPTATKVIYLDFDGHTTAGTLWNTAFNRSTITTPAYSFEGGGGFSDAEKERIQKIWERVTEDFLPFDVDVTTEDPGADALRKTGGQDTRWGIRVVIGGKSEDWFGSAGGVAYLESFNWDSDTPTYVFPGNLGSGAEKATSEAISHEVGHTLGLSHDGTSTLEYYGGHGSGATGWAPIMGVGYNRDIVTWSSGQYPGANNKQDDLKIIATQNGFDYRPDDHGNDKDAASPLVIDDTAMSGQGIIERTADLDFFSFTTGTGAITLEIEPFYRSPNLDISATLYDALGTVIEMDNAPTGLGASFSLDVDSGTYYLSIDGIGRPAEGSDAGYSDYGSLGFFSITGTRQPDDPGSVAGQVWDDQNRDGLKGDDEPGLADRAIFRDDNANGVFDSSLQNIASTDLPKPLVDISSITSEVVVSGFANVTDVNLSLNITHPWISDLIAYLISPSQTRVELFSRVGGSGDNFQGTTFDDEAGVSVTTAAAPFSSVFRPSELLSAFDGEDANGVWKLEVIDSRVEDLGVLTSWSLTIASEEQSAQTDQGGNYEFAEVRPGDYQFGLVPQDGWSQSFPEPPGFHAVTVASSQVVTGIDFGSHLTPAPTPPLADFNDDAFVDGTDFLLWQRGLGAAGGGLKSNGDADGDGDVDGADLGAWQGQFGPSALVQLQAAAGAADGAVALVAAVTEPDSEQAATDVFTHDPTDRSDVAGLNWPGRKSAVYAAVQLLELPAIRLFPREAFDRLDTTFDLGIEAGQLRSPTSAEIASDLTAFDEAFGDADWL